MFSISGFILKYSHLYKYITFNVILFIKFDYVPKCVGHSYRVKYQVDNSLQPDDSSWSLVEKVTHCGHSLI